MESHQMFKFPDQADSECKQELERLRNLYDELFAQQARDRADREALFQSPEWVYLEKMCNSKNESSPALYRAFLAFKAIAVKEVS